MEILEILKGSAYWIPKPQTLCSDSLKHSKVLSAIHLSSSIELATEIPGHFLIKSNMPLHSDFAVLRYGKAIHKKAINLFNLDK